jgi:hypothetical protein
MVCIVGICVCDGVHHPDSSGHDVAATGRHCEQSESDDDDRAVDADVWRRR